MGDNVPPPSVNVVYLWVMGEHGCYVTARDPAAATERSPYNYSSLVSVSTGRQSAPPAAPPSIFRLRTTKKTREDVTIGETASEEGG